MSKYLRSNREQLKTKIYSKLNMSLTQQSQQFIDRQSLKDEGSHEQLDKLMKQTEKRKLSIRKLINNNNPHSDFTDQMAQLKWRIDVLKNFTRNEKEKILMAHKTTSLTGKQDDLPQRQLTFDEMYELQKKKFSMLRERRKTKMGDPKYIEMIGNMQLRKQKRKNVSKSKVQDQMRMLSQSIEQRVE